jgi:hypothetical protein
LDLALRDHENGKYSVGLYPTVYDHLLAKLAGKSEADTLLTQRTAGFSTGVDTMSFLFVEGRKPVPFNIDTIKAINETCVSAKGDDDRQQDVSVKVVNTTSSGPLTFHQEKAGGKREVRVDLQIPEGTEDQVTRAMMSLGKKHGFLVEPTDRTYKPTTRQTKGRQAETFYTQATGEDRPMNAASEIRKFAAEIAAQHPGLAFDLTNLAFKVAQEQQQEGQQQGQQEGEDKKPDFLKDKDAAAKYAALKGVVIRTAAQNPAARPALVPVLQMLKQHQGG